jgi:hypothetical protein
MKKRSVVNVVLGLNPKHWTWLESFNCIFGLFVGDKEKTFYYIDFSSTASNVTSADSASSGVLMVAI